MPIMRGARYAMIAIDIIAFLPPSFRHDAASRYLLIIAFHCFAMPRLLRASASSSAREQRRRSRRFFSFAIFAGA